ncbi:MAG: hypothetical protein WCX12_02165 [Candidatus Paceibacterota bacterium]|jgi:hypothetical protein
MTPKKSITICSSASFFKQALDVEKELKTLGFAVKIPYTANVMKKSGDFRIETYKTWFKDAANYNRKSWLIKNHLQKIIKGDAVLILNYEKNGVPRYIGGNTLIEAAIGFHYKKPIFILNPISDNLNFKEEILGMQPKFLNGDLRKIS